MGNNNSSIEWFFVLQVVEENDINVEVSFFNT